MLDRSIIGTPLGPYVLPVELGQLKLFALATGQSDPAMLDQAVARARGYRGLLAPPTFVICTFMLAHSDMSRFLNDLGADPTRTLHAGQKFDYREPIFAGDVVTTVGSVVGIEANEKGTMDFLRFQLTATNQLGAITAIQESTMAVRYGRHG